MTSTTPQSDKDELDSISFRLKVAQRVKSHFSGEERAYKYLWESLSERIRERNADFQRTKDTRLKFFLRELELEQRVALTIEAEVDALSLQWEDRASKLRSQLNQARKEIESLGGAK